MDPISSYPIQICAPIRRRIRCYLVLIFGMLIMLSAPIREAHSQELESILTFAGGSGISLGKGNDTVIKKMSPIFLEVDVGLVFDGDSLMEWTPSLMMELYDRVSVGINPSLKRMKPLSKRFALYGIVGIPFYFAPFTLLGAEVGCGLIYNLTERFALVAEFHADVFFVGSDLPDDSVLAKLDLSVGIRFPL